MPSTLGTLRSAFGGALLDEHLKVLAALIDAAPGATPGTVEASKAVVVDANKDVTGFRNVGLTGGLTAAGNVAVTGTGKFVFAAAADPGEDATNLGADKVLEVKVGDTSYFIPVLDNNAAGA